MLIVLSLAMAFVMLVVFVGSAVLAAEADDPKDAVTRALVARMSLVGLLTTLLLASLPSLVRSVRDAVAPCDCDGEP